MKNKNTLIFLIALAVMILASATCQAQPVFSAASKNLEKYSWLISLPSLIFLSLFGMFIHFLKKNIKGETLTDITTYFKDNAKSTFIACVATIVGELGVYFTLMPDTISGESMALILITSFGTGYTFDSLFNKWDKPQ